MSNLGILIAPPKASDYILGGATKINIQREVKDWSPYLPEAESQRNMVTDFLDCVTMSAVHSLECQLNYLMASGLLSDEALFFFHNNGYIQNGSFFLSARFNAKMNGTDKTNGQYLNVAADCLRRDGILPGIAWRVTDGMAWEEFYRDAPANLILQAKEALWFLNIQYQWVAQPFSTLGLAPIQVATALCPGWDSGQVVQKCSGQPLQHATMLYGIDVSGNYADFDHYPPFKQKLSPDYELPFNLQYVVTPRPIALRNGMYGANVLKLQKDLNMLGFNLTEDSFYGPKTEMMVKNFQNKTALVSDGIAGPKTLSKLQGLIETPSITETITQVCNEEGIEPELALAVAQCESGLNPRAINVNSDKLQSTDRGLFQWNDIYHPEITEAMAFDPRISTEFFCQAVKAGNLHRFWSASEPRWKKLLPDDILKKYGIIS